jgi:HK97 family phage major capsid protein
MTTAPKGVQPAPRASAPTQPQPYSLIRAIIDGMNLHMNSNSPEFHASERIRKAQGHLLSNQVFIPNSVLAIGSRRDLSAGNTAALIETKVDTSITDALIPYSALIAAGMTVLPNLKENFQIARWATASSPQTLAENAASTPSTAETFSALQIGPPNRATVQIKLSSTWLTQTGFDAEASVVREINRAIASKIDALCIADILAASQNTGDATSTTQNLALLGAGQTFGGAPTWATLQAMKKTVINNNTDVSRGDLRWVLSGDAYNVLSTTPKISGYPSYLLEDGKIGPDPVVTTTNLSSTNQALFGKFAAAVLGLWPISIVSDPITQMHTGTVMLTVNLLYSFGLLQGTIRYGNPVKMTPEEIEALSYAKRRVVTKDQTVRCIATIDGKTIEYTTRAIVHGNGSAVVRSEGSTPN